MIERPLRASRISPTKENAKIWVNYTSEKERLIVFSSPSDDFGRATKDLGLYRFGSLMKYDHRGWHFRLKEGADLETAVSVVREYRRVVYLPMETLYCYAICPECGEKVEILSETLFYNWNEEKQVFEHGGFTPHGYGECCNLSFMSWALLPPKVLASGVGKVKGKKYNAIWVKIFNG